MLNFHYDFKCRDYKKYLKNMFEAVCKNKCMLSQLSTLKLPI